MKAEITFSQVWYNASLLNFFFRTQAKETLEQLMNATADSEVVVLDSVEEYAEMNDFTLDDIEEMFYEETLQELACDFRIDLLPDYEEDND